MQNTIVSAILRLIANKMLSYFFVIISFIYELPEVKQGCGSILVVVIVVVVVVVVVTKSRTKTRSASKVVIVGKANCW